MQAAIKKAKPKSNRDLVTLLIGVNNQYRGRSVEQYQAEFEQLLKQAISFARNDPNRVIVVSIPDYGLTPFIANTPDRDAKQIASELDTFNSTARKITKKHSAHWVDITKASRREGAKKIMLADDGLHPSGEMYKLWVKEILPTARKILSAEKSKSK